MRTCPRSAADSRRRQTGLSGLVVVFAIALFGSLAGWAAGLATASAETVSQTAAVARAREAAATGADWARWRLRVPAAPLCAASQNLALPGTLARMTVTTRCALLGTYVEGGVTVRRWRVTADACNQPQAGACPSAAPAADYVQASASAVVER